MKYIFVIPTLNRADVLHWSIESILEQEGKHEIEIIVSNNKSDDATEKVVAGYADTRIRYVEPALRLSMSKNWEFASQYIDCEDSVVCYLGDDDLLSPDALNIVDSLMQDSKIDAVSRTTGYYYTQDCNNALAGWLSLPLVDGSVEIKESHDVLKDVAMGKSHYGKLPTLYHGFVRGKLISEIKKHGPLFNKAAPDIYSDIALACIGVHYAHVRYPITLGVASPKSNGLNSLTKSRIGEEFIKDSLRDMPHTYYIGSVSMQTLESLEELLSLYELLYDISYGHFYRSALAEIPHRDIGHAMHSLAEIGGRSNWRITIDSLSSRLASRLKISAKALLYKSGLLDLYTHNASSRQNAFMYFGDLAQSEGLTSPQECLAFIRNNVKYRGIEKQ
jgi:glycosyltransferase involved in cell wall biosynthesis